MKLDRLYKRTKTGAIQYYEVQARQSDLAEGAQIHKESGQLGTTKPIVHIESVHTGKNIGKSNETSPYEQAVLQAKSDWQRKRDEGYKSLEDLGIYPIREGAYSFKGKDAHEYKLALALEHTLPTFNSDASGNVKPMLAKTVDWNKVTYPCYVQPKLDGVRCLLVVSSRVERDDKHFQSVKFLSRSGKEYFTLGHIGSDVYNYLLGQDDSAEFILDGEIYSDSLSFQEIVAAVKKLRPDSLKLHFRAYDIVNGEYQSKRINDARSLVAQMKSDYVHFVQTLQAEDKDDILNFHDIWVRNGYEGAMVRLIDGHYAQGQRSSHLYKVKQFDEAEFAFKNFEFGQRGVEDLIAVCWIHPLNADPQEGEKEFRAKMVGTKSEKEYLYAQNDLEGKSLTVKHFGWTDDGLPRFPIGKGFRDY